MTWFTSSPTKTSQAPAHLKALYDSAATGWQDGIHKLGFGAAYAQLATAAVPKGARFDRVVDVGTGTGALAQAILQRIASPSALTLVDMSPAMLATAADRVPATRVIEAALGDPLHLPPQDLVLCAHVIEHCPDPKAAIRALFDLAAPGGRLVLAVSKPHWCTALVRWRWGNMAYRPTEVTEMLRDAGFENPQMHKFSSGPPSRVSCGYSASRPVH